MAARRRSAGKVARQSARARSGPRSGADRPRARARSGPRASRWQKACRAAPARRTLGWQCWKGDPEGRWVLRQRTAPDKYAVEAIGRADDRDPADGTDVCGMFQISHDLNPFWFGQKLGGSRTTLQEPFFLDNAL